MSTSTKISRDATLWTPPDAKPHELIVLCTWLGGTGRPVSKYITMYQTVAPQTPILHIASHVLTVTPPYPFQRAQMSESIKVIQNTISAAASSSQAPKIQIHTFSNGGSNSATQLLIAHQARTGEKIPIHSLVLDSSPAKGEYWKSYHSITLSMPPSPFFKYIVGPIAGHLVPGWMLTGAKLGLYPVFEDLIRDTLLSEEVLEGRKSVVYLWGKGDLHVDWEDVKSHAEEAEGKGWLVRSEEFEGSVHVGHWRVEPERYERVVKETWEQEGK
ncbi:indole-diterpene biosynthesis protein-like protein PaxU [Dendryphion nanum]|uniref:Indole-diterpene biosynthesis protein-like protein PaxU n=1 Tax=Dendryphion nanum TaxID=256645 RepID=A0A9P9DRJ6_9PLEO|nr:indole-diterpene biosynthesis protein-like protein PaxU [Dendryphion nanum]